MTQLYYFTFAFCFSWLSPILTSRLFNVNFIEPFLGLAIALAWSDSQKFRITTRQLLKSRITVFILLYLLLCFIISFAYESANPAEAYADLRSLITFYVVVYAFGISRANQDRRELSALALRLCILISIMDAIALSYRISFNQEDIENIKNVISITAPILAMLLLIRRQNFGAGLIFLLIAIYEAAFGFLRIYYIFVALALFVYLFYFLAKIFSMHNTKSKSIALIAIVAGIFFIPSIYTQLIDYYESDPRRMIHSINRSLELYEGGLSGEAERLGSVLSVFGSPERFIFPHGLGWRSSVERIYTDFSNYSVISSMDSSFFYINYHLGLAFGAVITIGFIFLSFHSLVRPKYSFALPLSHRLVLGIIFLLSFFSSSAMLTNPQSAFAFALVFVFAFLR